ncbi:Glutamate receptor ionotropic, delta-1, partial [Araneus ventricosus]
MIAKYPQKIKVAVLPFGDLMRINTSVEGKMEFSGVEGEILNVLLESLGLQYDFVIPKDLQWGRLEKDGNWSGMVGMIQRDEADLAFSYLSMTEERSRVIGYSKPYMFEEHTFISQMPSNRRFTLTFLYPFDFSTWICLFLTLVLMSTLLAICKSGIQSLGNQFFRLFASLMTQALNTDSGSRKYNMLVAFWLLFAQVIVLSYSSTLLSFLIQPLKEAPIRNFNELSRAVQRGNYQANFTNFSLSFLLNSNLDHFLKLGKIVSSNNWIANTSALSSETVIKPNFFLALNKNLAKSYF